MSSPFSVSRRTAFKAAAAGAVAAFPARQAAAAKIVLKTGTTLDSTIRRGAATRGFVALVSGPGEPHQLRADLGIKPGKGRTGRRRSLLAFAHLTDIHVIDAQSPARVEYTDRYNDSPGDDLLFSAAYRPHEMLTVQVADSIVRAVEKVRRGPTAGGDLAFAICTGDNIDNCQKNELRWQIDVLDGKTVRADSGSMSKWEGVHDQDPNTYDLHYWHPDGAPAGKEPDRLRALHGFPVVKGLLDAARRPFKAYGLRRPWYTCYGNHDGLVQGNFPESFRLSNVATGSLKITSLPAGVSFQDLSAGRVSPGLLNAPVRQVTPDANRVVLTRAQTIAEHFKTGGLPLGHGYTADNVKKNTAYYTFDPAPYVRCIVMDTVNANGNSDGSLDAVQMSWLTNVLATSKNKIVLVFSHHTMSTMTNKIPLVDEPGERVEGPAVLALLLRYPNVVAWVNGHTHQNRVTPRPRIGGGGLWEISTAAHVDWPAQARIIEIIDNRDGTLSVVCTIIDADAPLSYAGRTDSPAALASLARQLSANDPQEFAVARAGRVEDRNVELLVAAPFVLR